MTVNKKNGNSPRGANRSPPSGNTGAGSPGSPPYSPLDLDMEELSGSLLVDEPPGRGALIVTKGSSSQGFAPFSPAASYPPPPRASAPLPKPNPPPKHEVLVRPSDPEPAPVPSEPATVEDLPTVDLRDLASTYGQLTSQPAPAAESPEAAGRARPPAAAPLTDHAELATLPIGVRSPAVSALRNRLRSAFGRLPSRDWLFARRRVWALAALVLAGLVAGMGLAVWVAGAARGPSDGALLSPQIATTTAPPMTPAAAVSALPPPDPSPGPSACIGAGEPRVIAPKATVTAGIEIRAFGSDIALGFAPNEHQAMLVRLDPASLATVESTVTASADPIRRVTPIPGKKKPVGIAVDVDRKGDPLRGRRTLAVDPPVQLGVSDSSIAWAPMNRGIAGKLWPLEHDETVEAQRGTRSGSNPSMLAVVFRRAGGVWVGTAEGSGALAPKGSLARVGSLGKMVGSPAIAVNDSVGLVAWADRTSPDDPWLLRWVRFTVGEAPGEPATLTPPSGGNGQQAMSPGLTVAPGGRFLLTWTQGPAAVHEVRALTLSAEGAPLGAPLSISSVGANAGQGQAAVTAGGRGVVAFLESTANGFQVVATPIACAP